MKERLTYRNTQLDISDIDNRPPDQNDCHNKAHDIYNTERIKSIYDNFLYILEEKKVYLNPQINLTKLSQLLYTNTSYLSKVINIYFQCNLKTLLNQYRINYAKELLKKGTCNIQSLPKQCGFISRSTFYAAFTKFEHITPTDYRAKYHSSENLKGLENNINRLSTI